MTDGAVVAGSSAGGVVPCDSGYSDAVLRLFPDVQRRQRRHD